jgi:hypothetical protein
VVVAKYVFKHGFIFLELRVLVEERNTYILVYPDFAFIGNVFTRQDIEQGCFARAVFGNQGNFIPLFDIESYIGKKRLFYERLSEVLNVYIMHMGAKVAQKTAESGVWLAIV